MVHQCFASFDSARPALKQAPERAVQVALAIQTRCMRAGGSDRRAWIARAMGMMTHRLSDLVASLRSMQRSLEERTRRRSPC